MLTSDTATGDAGDKFLSDPNDLIIGEFENAAGGLGELLCVDEDDLNGKMARGVEAMREEVEALGDTSLKFHFDYVVDETVSEMEFPQGTRDKGRAGYRINHFLNMPQAKTAGLKEADTVAMRIYTTPAFKYLNAPLRNLERFRRK